MLAALYRQQKRHWGKIGNNSEVFSHWRFTAVSVIQLQGRSKHSMCNNQRHMCSCLVCTERSVSKVSQERGRLETNTKITQTGLGFSKLLRGCGWKTHLHRLSKRSRLTFYNYTYFYSIVLMVVCDAQYRFLFADMGSYGRDSDAAIFCKSELSIGFEMVI